MKGRALLFSAFKAVEDLAIWAGAKAAADPARRERAVIFIMVWCRKVCFVCSMKMLCDVAKPGQKCICFTIPTVQINYSVTQSLL